VTARPNPTSRHEAVQSATARAGTAPARKSSLGSLLLDWKALLGFAISGILLYFTFRGRDFSAIGAELRRANPVLLIVGTAFATFIFWIRAWRWRSILDPVHRGTSFRSRFAGVTIGTMGNNLLPARVGEFARAYAFSRMEPVSVVAAFSSLVIERLMDGVFLVAFLFLAMVLPDFPGLGSDGNVTYVTVARSLVFMLALAFVVLFLMVLWPARVVTIMERMLSVLPVKVRRPLIDALEAFLKGVSVLRDPQLVLKATWWSGVLWLVNAIGFWFAFRAFGMPLPLSAALFFQSCLALAVSVPSGPAFAGPYQYASVLVLATLWGQEESKALAFAVGFHISGFLPVTLIGLYYAQKIGLSLGKVARTEEEVEQAVERETGIDPGDPRPPQHD
jgi:uncharacterized protein (TIRG00374 family)